MLGPGRYVKVDVGRMTYNLVLRPDSPAYMACKQREREQRMALSWEKVALTFWADRVVPADELGGDLKDKVPYGLEKVSNLTSVI